MSKAFICPLELGVGCFPFPCVMLACYIAKELRQSILEDLTT